LVIEKNAQRLIAYSMKLCIHTSYSLSTNWNSSSRQTERQASVTEVVAGGFLTKFAPVSGWFRWDGN